MKADLVVGLQWGDEGKGKIVDLLSQKYDVVCRYQGGHNAGHTIVVDDTTYALHLLPSGVLNPQAINIIGNGVVIHLESLIGEMNNFEQSTNTTLNNRLFISHKAHIIFEFHQKIDAYNEQQRGKESIGTTGKGIGPTYVDKINRTGFRMLELLNVEQLAQKLSQRFAKDRDFFDKVGYAIPSDDELKTSLESYAKRLTPFICNTTHLLQQSSKEQKRILLEGAQGSLLDIDHGTYPFVTSSNTLSAGACLGLGIPPKSIHKVIGIAKAYTTRVGSGPFPTEDEGEYGERMGKVGKEFGTTTGRKRRCGWFDAVSIKETCAINGCDEIALMKLDVLDGIDEIKVCVGYRDREGNTLDESQMFDLNDIEPVYQSFAGWDKTTGISSFEELPKNARDYISFIASFCETKIALISTSPKRKDTILL